MFATRCRYVSAGIVLVLLPLAVSAIGADRVALPGNPYAVDERRSCGPLCVGFLDAYAMQISAPLVTGAHVHSVLRGANGYVVRSSAGTFSCPVVVIATGQCDEHRMPALAAGLAPSLYQIHAAQYLRSS